MLVSVTSEVEEETEMQRLAPCKPWFLYATKLLMEMVTLYDWSRTSDKPVPKILGVLS